MNYILFFALAFFMGVVAPVQGSINAQLGKYLNHPLWASLISFLGGVFSLIVLIIIMRPPVPDFTMLKDTSWYHYTGGLLGIIFVTGMIVLIPKIGAANLLATVIAGQLIMSIIFDHFGWMGLPEKTISLNRVIGVLLLIAGVYLIQRK